ncbi:MAG: hypothetical protein KGY75_10625 [Candidatus Cloacimonetes bacterium]|nr:hypothetical protein [Candidatus Cloacimonadota bacterium]
MKTKLLLILLATIIISTPLSADYFIPLSDPVYPLLEDLYISNHIDKSYSIYPQYHKEITDILKELKTQKTSSTYQNLITYHLNRLTNSYEEGLSSSIYPLKNIPQAAKNIFNTQKQKSRLITYKKSDTKLFLSYIMGLNYDIKKNNSDLDRRYDYYGLQFGGNIRDNFGFYTQYRKGHYEGDEEFILADHKIHRSGGMYRKVTTASELDFKNKYLNLAVGYGNFTIGNPLTSSIILNHNTNPYSYLKYYHKYGNFYFMGFNSQLFPDSVVSTTDDYQQKSLAVQTLNYSTDNFKFGVGQGVIYGDKSIDLAYLTPLMVYKLIDFKNHNRDNEFVFSYLTARPFPSTYFYANFFMDDLKKARLKTKYALQALAFQFGLKYQLKKIPLQVGLESTIIGPKTYGHSPRYGVDTRYTHDDQTLGYEYGANLMNNAVSLQYRNTFFDIQLIYENLQQGNLGSNPFVWYKDDIEFLGEEMTRSQYLTVALDLHPGFYIDVSLEYRLAKQDDKELHQFFTGVEVKY